MRDDDVTTRATRDDEQLWAETYHGNSFDDDDDDDDDDDVHDDEL